MNLKQTNLVVESRRQFENIIATSCELPQKFLKEAFLNGLKPEITEGQAILLYWLIMTERDGAETWKQKPSRSLWEEFPGIVVFSTTIKESKLLKKGWTEDN